MYDGRREGLGPRATAVIANDCRSPRNAGTGGYSL